MIARFPGLSKSFLFFGRQVRLGNLLITKDSGLEVEYETLVHVRPGADHRKLAAAIRAGEEVAEETFAVRPAFNRVLLIGPAGDLNLVETKIPPKGVYRIAYHLLTRRDDTDVVIYDPNYWTGSDLPVLERPYDIVGISSLFFSFVHDAETLARLHARYPRTRSALHVLGGMTATHWDAETIFRLPIELAVKGFGGERALSEIIDQLPEYRRTMDLTVFSRLNGVMVRNRPGTFHPLPRFYTQEDFSHAVHADHRFVPFDPEQDIAGYAGYFPPKAEEFRPLNEVGVFPLHLLSFQMICRGRCIFCSSMSKQYLEILRQNKQSPVVRIAPEDLIEIIKEAKRQNPRIDNVRFDEDNFLFDPRAARRFGELMIQTGLNKVLPWKMKTRIDHVAKNPELVAFLRKAGLFGVDLGIESFDQPTLDEMQKDISVRQIEKALELLVSLGLEVIQINLILFPPKSSMEQVLHTMDRTLEYAAQKGVFVNMTPRMVALPGAPLMSMPEYRDLITYQEKTLPGGAVIRRPGILKITDEYAQEIAERAWAEVAREVAEYERSSLTKTPEYIWPLLFFRTIYKILIEKEGPIKYADRVKLVDALIDKLTEETRRINEHGLSG